MTLSGTKVLKERIGKSAENEAVCGDKVDKDDSSKCARTSHV